jgi:uncharacterized membrane protein
MGGPVPPVGAPAAAPMAQNVACTLCYILGFITGIIFLVLEPYKNDRTVRFHAFQSIFLNVALIAGSIVLSIVLGVMTSMSASFWFVSSAIHGLYSLCCLVLWVYMLVSAYQGKTVVLPVVGPLAQKQA